MQSRIHPEFRQVFANVNLPDADDLLAKADLATKIIAEVQGQPLTQSQAAEILGIGRPKASALSMRSSRAFRFARRSSVSNGFVVDSQGWPQPASRFSKLIGQSGNALNLTVRFPRCYRGRDTATETGLEPEAKGDPLMAVSAPVLGSIDTLAEPEFAT